ncbi:DNA topoisomerase [Fructobacillus tropaeoli]|uniref:DNA topoisomerase n=1 Tax=Fructobacillus tropaeoli TaxID=709323 RepID=A0A3F3H731_9LACO|nr:DNA topoisomerase [Fructobacillus tropaeoli]
MRGDQLVSTELFTRQGLPDWFNRKSGKGALFFATPLILKGAFSDEDTEKIINEEDVSDGLVGCFGLCFK